MKQIKELSPVVITFLIFSLLILFPNIIKATHYCYNTWDFGIFVQAIKGFSLTEFNPVISQYGFKIFNDHFDPILYLASLIIPGAYPSIGLVVLEISLLAVALVPMVLLYRKEIISKRMLVFLSVGLLFSKGTIAASFYPVHPTTWAMVALSFLFYFIHQNNRVGEVLALIFLFMCKEEFPFVGIMYSFYMYFFRKDKKAGVGVLFLSVCWLIFAIKLRPLIFEGAFNDHGSRFLTNLFNDPLSLIKKYNFAVFKYIVGLSLPFVSIFIYGNKKTWSFFWVPIFICLPMFALRILSSSWGFQYSAPLVVPLIFLFIPTSGERNRLSNRAFIVFCLVFLGIASSEIRRNWQTVLGFKKQDSCEVSSSRIQEISLIKLNKFDNCSRIYSTGGVSVLLSEMGLAPKTIRSVEGISQQRGDCIVLDIKGSDPYPLSKNGVRKVMSKLGKPSFDGDYFKIYGL